MLLLHVLDCAQLYYAYFLKICMNEMRVIFGTCSLCMMLFMMIHTIYLQLLSRSITDHHLRCGGWLNFEFSKRGKTFGMGH